MGLKYANEEELIKLRKENAELRQWRAEVTCAVIHSSEDTEGGLRYDEVCQAIKNLAIKANASQVSASHMPLWEWCA